MTEKISKGVGGRGDPGADKAPGGVSRGVTGRDVLGVGSSGRGLGGDSISSQAVFGFFVAVRVDEESSRTATALRAELSNIRDLMRCPRKLFLHDRLQAPHARKVRS